MISTRCSLLLAVFVGACAGSAPAEPVAPVDVPAEATHSIDVESAPEIPPLDDVGARADESPHVDAVDASVAADIPVVDGGAPRCTATAVLASDFERRIRVGGVDRVFRVHVPRSYVATRPTMVVLNFHGFLNTDALQADISNMHEASDMLGFVAVHPRGRDTSWNAGVCCGLAMSRGDDDVAFVRALLDALAMEVCVDTRRVFATGFSNGGFFANRLACELSDRIAAIAPVAGSLGIAQCAPRRAVPVLHTHGDADLLVPFNGSPALRFPSAADSVRGWAMRNGCASSVTEVYNRGDARCVSFDRCPPGGEVQLCTIRGGGHAWPGGDPIPLAGHTSRDIDITAYMLSFFARHPMP